VPGNAVWSVGNLWGNTVPARTCGISVGRADALLSPLTIDKIPTHDRRLSPNDWRPTQPKHHHCPPRRDFRFADTENLVRVPEDGVVVLAAIPDFLLAGSGVGGSP